MCFSVDLYSSRDSVNSYSCFAKGTILKYVEVMYCNDLY